MSLLQEITFFVSNSTVYSDCLVASRIYLVHSQLFCHYRSIVSFHHEDCLRSNSCAKEHCPCKMQIIVSIFIAMSMSGWQAGGSSARQSGSTMLCSVNIYSDIMARAFRHSYITSCSSIKQSSLHQSFMICFSSVKTLASR
jgi:hypothetical protein